MGAQQSTVAEPTQSEVVATSGVRSFWFLEQPRCIGLNSFEVLLLALLLTCLTSPLAECTLQRFGDLVPTL